VKNDGLEQTEKWLAQSNTSVTNLELWKQAKGFAELKNILNTTKSVSIFDTYSDLIEFDRQLADESFEGAVNEPRQSQILHY